MRTEITVVNTSRDEVWRAGYVFRPRQERTVSVTKNGYREIRACQALTIFEPGVRCDHPGCAFVAKNESGLRFHKRAHQQVKAGE